MSSAGHPEKRPDKVPDIVFSMGDPNGIGPEITLKALDILLRKVSFAPVLAGNPEYLITLADDLGLALPWDRIEIVRVGEKRFIPEWGKVDRHAGELAFASLETASELCLKRGFPLLVTAPVNKESLRMAGFRFPGQTEFLAHTFPSEHYCMAFLSRSFHLLLATIHIPLSEVPGALDSRELYEKCCLFHEALNRLTSGPRIGVCGLNPHASENSLFGDEERVIISPVIEKLNDRFGSDTFSGPFPPDSIFTKTLSGEFNAIVAMYHDQGLIPLKLLDFNSTVNTTLGLPVIRTSPGHGTAFDIAGRKTANPENTVEAIKWGLRLAYNHSGAESDNDHTRN
ncbi:MAG: 4-hydroxythreonine-4-phosphate dehydrogenase PdxA [Acidobacteriota bacterium]